MDKLILPVLAWLGLIYGMLVLSSTLSWIYYVAYYRRVRAGAITAERAAPSALASIVLHRAPWLILLLAGLLYWLLDGPESPMRFWFLCGLAASVLVVAVIGIVGYRRMRGGSPTRAPAPGNPWWPRR